MFRSVLFCVVLCVESSAAVLTGTVSSFFQNKPLPGAVEFQFRQIDTNAQGIATLQPLAQFANSITAEADANGSFEVELPEGYVAIRVVREGFAEYFNTLVKIEPGKKNSLPIELQSAEPSAAEIELLERRRNEARMIQQFEEAEDGTIAKDIAAAEPVVPTLVHVNNVNGYTGNMNLDEFIAGVVTAEMNDGFPYEALKAQAVAARTFALVRQRDRGQANGGQAYSSTHGTKSRAATYNSSGVALTYQSRFITAFFSARCNGDFTLASEDGPATTASCVRGGLVGTAIAYLRSVPCSGHINCSQTSETCCQLNVNGKINYIYGHGVGLCQRGAQQLASRDALNWQQIVNRYYTSVTTLPGNQLRVGDRISMIAAANRRTIPCGGTATSTTSGALGTVIAGPQIVPCTLISGSSHVTWWRVAFDSGGRAWMAEDFLRKDPQSQPAPSVDLDIAATTPESIAITVNGRANLRFALEESSPLGAWNAVSTNALSSSGAAVLQRVATGEDRYFRARLILPDTNP